MKAEGEPRLQMHQDDAAQRGIVDGDMVRVFNQRGSLQIRAQVVDQFGARVVAMSHGWWASRMSGGSSANALTPDGLSDLGAAVTFTTRAFRSRSCERSRLLQGPFPLAVAIV